MAVAIFNSEDLYLVVEQAIDAQVRIMSECRNTTKPIDEKFERDKSVYWSMPFYKRMFTEMPVKSKTNESIVANYLSNNAWSAYNKLKDIQKILSVGKKISLDIEECELVKPYMNNV